MTLDDLIHYLESCRRENVGSGDYRVRQLFTTDLEVGASDPEPSIGAVLDMKRGDIRVERCSGTVWFNCHVDRSEEPSPSTS